MNYEQNLQTEQFMNSFKSKTVPAIFHFPSADSCMPQRPEKYKCQVLKIFTFFSHFQTYMYTVAYHVHNISEFKISCHCHTNSFKVTIQSPHCYNINFIFIAQCTCTFLRAFFSLSPISSWLPIQENMLRPLSPELISHMFKTSVNGKS